MKVYLFSISHLHTYKLHPTVSPDPLLFCSYNDFLTMNNVFDKLSVPNNKDYLFFIRFSSWSKKINGNIFLIRYVDINYGNKSRNTMIGIFHWCYKVMAGKCVYIVLLARQICVQPANSYKIHLNFNTSS